MSRFLNSEGMFQNMIFKCNKRREEGYGLIEKYLYTKQIFRQNSLTWNIYAIGSNTQKRKRDEYGDLEMP